MRGNQDYLLWLDIETTGLDPKSDDILEIGAALYRSCDYEMVASKDWVFPLPKRSLPDIDDVVLKMHVDSGLWAECRKVTDVPQHLFYRFSSWVMDKCHDTRRDGAQAALPLIPAGSSVHFDLSFLEAKCPDAMLWIAEGSFDVSVIRHAVKLAAPAGWVDPIAERYAQAKPHRALADAILAAESFREYSELLWHGMEEANFHR